MCVLRVVTVAVVAGSFPASASAADGIVLTQQLTRATGQVTTMDTQITKTKLKAEYSGPTGTEQIVIFDGAQQVLYRIDPARKTYMATTKAEVDQMGGLMAGMQAQLANMPPAQRAQMEALMRGRMGASASAATQKTMYKKTGTAKVGRRTCDTYDGTRGDQKVSEICTVAPAALGFTAADFEVSRQLSAFFAAMIGGAADQVASLGRPEVEGFAGLPVKSTTFVNGQSITTEMLKAARQNIPDNTFDIPAGFTQQTTPGMGRGARGR
jgi:hypothetical protein